MILNNQQEPYLYHIILYRDTNPYEDTYHDAYIFERRFEFDEITSEHAPGGRYGIKHKIEGDAFNKFKDLLCCDGETLADSVYRAFDGEEGLRKFSGRF